MTVILTLSSAGTDVSLFDLYSDIDSYSIAFETGVSKAALIAGYTTSACPDYATIVRVQATGQCVNYMDIILSQTTTTTTSSTSTTTSTSTSTSTSTTTSTTTSTSSTTTTTTTATPTTTTTTTTQAPTTTTTTTAALLCQLNGPSAVFYSPPTTTTTTTTTIPLDNSIRSSSAIASGYCNSTLDTFCFVEQQNVNVITIGDRIWNDAFYQNYMVGTSTAQNLIKYHIELSNLSGFGVGVNSTGYVINQTSICYVP